jgi:hypothetical protein
MFVAALAVMAVAGREYARAARMLGIPASVAVLLARVAIR